jgi:hypothetical protein
MTIKFALKTIAVAAALAFSTAGHAAIHYSNAGHATVNAAGTTWTGDTLDVAVYDLTGTTLGNHILAFCIEPLVEQAQGTVYTQQGTTSNLTFFNDPAHASRDTMVKALFETQYASLTNVDPTIQKVNRVAFQLALWEIVADNANITSGNYLYNSLSNKYVSAANDMLLGIDGYTVLGKYNYTTFNGVAGSKGSQDLISVSAVPEADTWAMLAAGLGLIGFMGRRNTRRTEKFAA